MPELDPALLKKEYETNLPLYNRLLDETVFILRNAIKQDNIKIYSIPSRIKTLDSFFGKIMKKQLDNPFEQIQDIVGIRIVCLFLSDVARIGTIIRSHFRIMSEDDKLAGNDIASFGYLSVHFIAKLKEEYNGPRYDGLLKIPFEIQVRTLAMDAWANISHYLDYKSEQDVPKELRKDFYALSGLFYVADTHFEMFFKSKEKIAKSLKESDLDLSQEINLETLTAYLQKKFPNRKHAEPNYVSELTTHLLKNGYEYLNALDLALEPCIKDFLIWENTHPPADEHGEKRIGNKFYDVGVINVMLRNKFLMDNT